MSFHGTWLCLNYNTFKIRDLHEMSLLTLTHKIVYNPNNLPKVYHDYLALTRHIHEYNTRSHVNINIHPHQRHQVCSTVGSKDFS